MPVDIDNFNSKAKTLDAFNFAKTKNSKLKASRPPLTQSRVLLKENSSKRCLLKMAPNFSPKTVQIGAQTVQNDSKTVQHGSKTV